MKLMKLFNVLNHRMIRLAGCLTLALLASCAGVATAENEEEPKGDGRTVNWALLVGAGNYQDPRVKKLTHTISDLDGLESTLVNRGNYLGMNILKLHDKPGKELPKLIADFLTPANGGPDEDDQLLVYFTGHGFTTAGPNADLYLAPVDFDVKNPKGAGLDVRDFRGLVEKCPAKTKFLIIDSCFAGNNGAAATEIENRFDGMDRVVTLASSTAKEESIVWNDRGHSLFTYWLIEALKGNADSSMDGEVTFDELYAFVHKKVTNTAATTFGKDQTPVASMRFSSKGFPTITKLQAFRTLDELFAGMAEQIVRAVEDQTLHKIVALPPFLYTSYRDLKELDSAPANDEQIGLTCANRFHGALDAVRSNPQRVVKIQTMEAALAAMRATKATTQNVGTWQGVSQIEKQFDTGSEPPPVVVYGEMLQRHPDTVQVRVRAIRNDTKSTLIETGGLAKLNNDEFFEANSVVVRGDDFDLIKSRSATPIEQWQERIAKEPHPLRTESFPFRVNILVRNPERRGKPWIPTPQVPIGDRIYVALKKDEIYRINVEYQNVPGAPNQGAFLKLLVDGLSIRDQHGPPNVREGAEVKIRGANPLVQDPVSLEKSQVWFLRPETNDVGNRIHKSESWTFEGFYLTDTWVCPFEVCDASESRGLADQLGVITAVFYEEIAARGPEFATRAAEPRLAERAVRRVEAGEIGNPLGSVHIHYVSPGHLDQLREQVRAGR